MDTDMGHRSMFGAEYEFSQETKVTVQHMEVAQNLVNLTESMVVV